MKISSNNYFYFLCNINLVYPTINIYNCTKITWVIIFQGGKNMDIGLPKKILVATMVLLFVGAAVLPGISGIKTRSRNINIVQEKTDVMVKEEEDFVTFRSLDSLNLISHLATQADIDQLKAKSDVYGSEKIYSPTSNSYGAGVVPPTEEEWDSMVGNLRITERITSPLPLRAAVDLSTDVHFPEVRSQGSQNSCVGWATGYYNNGYLQAKKFGWTGASTGNNDQLLSPAFVYNKCAVDNDQGSSFLNNLGVLHTIGVCRESKMPYDEDDAWSAGDEAAWRDAPEYRINQYSMMTSPYDDTDISSIKTLINTGYPVNFAIYVTSYIEGLGQDDDTISSSEIRYTDWGHAQTIVGYDDSKGEGLETGAFKVVNSWGENWGTTWGPRYTNENETWNGDGFYWITYEAYKIIERESYYFDVLYDVDESPKLLGVWDTRLGRRNIRFKMGIGSNLDLGEGRVLTWNFRGDYSLPDFMCMDVTEFYDEWIAGSTDFHLVVGSSSTQNARLDDYYIEYHKDGYSADNPYMTSEIILPDPGQSYIQGPTKIVTFFPLVYNVDKDKLYAEIQEAITDANPDDIIEVYPGTYSENLIIDKPLTLIARDKEQTIIDGGGSSSVIYVTADGVGIHGFTIQNSAEPYGKAIYVISDNNTFTGNTITDTYYGLRVDGNNNTISNNTCIDNTDSGIMLLSARDNVISGNNGSNNYNGIYIGEGCRNNIISCNVVTSNEYSGIYLDGEYDIVSDNFAQNNENGIRLRTDNEVINGNVLDGNEYGIYLYSSSENVITQNDIVNNTNYGIHLFASSSDNIIYHNNFIDNNIQAYNVGTNTWNRPYPSGGNYWNDYTDVDSGGDGIWDNAYTFSSGGTDNYPFVAQNEWYNQGYKKVYNLETGTSYNTVQTAVTNAGTGDRILVDAGQYNEHVTIDKKITIIGADRFITIIYKDNIPVVDIAADDITFLGFYVFSNRVNLNVTSNSNQIVDNFLHGQYGIRIENGDENIICDNIINEDYYGGISLRYSDNNILSKNTVYDSSIIGINVEYSNYNFIAYCSVDDSTLGIELWDSDDNILYYNSVDMEDYIGDNWAGIRLAENCNDNKLYRNDVRFADYGILIQTSDDNFVKDNTVVYNEIDGIYIEESASNVLTGNNVSGNIEYGIHLMNAEPDNIIVGNNVKDNEKHGICLNFSNWNTIRSNRCSRNHIDGIHLNTCDYNDILGNTANSNTNAGIKISSSHNNRIIRNACKWNQYCAIHLDSSNNNDVHNNIIFATGTTQGIVISSGVGNHIQENTAIEAEYAIKIQGGSYNPILDSILLDNDYGIYIDGSDYNDITDNTIEDNKNGITLTGSDFNTISGNLVDNINVIDYSIGIRLSTCSVNNVSSNQIQYCNLGIALVSSHVDNQIQYNSILNCGQGIFLSDSDDNQIFENMIKDNEYGLYSEQSNSFGSGFIYNNYFIDNIIQQAYDTGTPPPAYQWYDMIKGGNYWSDYTGTDNNLDGFGDTAYSIPPGFLQDMLPLYDNPPNIPSNPIPGNESTDISIYTLLNWAGGDLDPEDIVTYDLYFGTDNPPPLVASELTDTEFSLGILDTIYGSGILDYDTQYYWQIIATDSYYKSTEGPIWTFTTEPDDIPQILFYPTNDTFIDELQKDNNYGLLSQLIARRGGTGYKLHTLTKFDISSIPPGTTISSAAVHFYYYHYNDGNPSGKPLTINRILQDWDESTVTWNNKPTHDGTVIDTITMPGSTDQWIEWDVSTEIQNFIDGVANNYGWKIIDISSSGFFSMIYFWSKDYGGDLNLHPYLEIEYESPQLLVEGECTYEDFQPVDPVNVEIKNIDTGLILDADITENSYSLSLTPGVNINVSETLQIMAKDDTNFVNVTYHIVTQDDLDSGSIIKDLILDEYYLDLIDFPMYLAEDDNPTYTANQLCGPTVAQMNLDYMWWNSTEDPEELPTWCDDNSWNQSELYDYGVLNNYNPSLSYLDATGLHHIIQTLDPDYADYGYNFNIYHSSNSEYMLSQICKWIDYPAGTNPDHPLHVPGAVPTFGDYSRWMSIRGIHTNSTAYPTPDALEVKGFWVNDPYPSGIGENTYKMAPEWLDVYYKPITATGDLYDGEYVAICEPPIGGDCDLTLKESTEYWDLKPPVRKGGPSILQQILDHLIIHAAREGVREQLVPYDDDFASVFDDTFAGRPLLVKNLLEDKHDYYVVSFNNVRTLQWIPRGSHAQPEEDITLVVVLVDATTGQFKEASWVHEPVNYLPMSRADAMDIVFDELINLGYNPDELNVRQIDSDLVYRDSSPFYPDWRIIIGELDITFFISQDGTINYDM